MTNLELRKWTTPTIRSSWRTGLWNNKRNSILSCIHSTLCPKIICCKVPQIYSTCTNKKTVGNNEIDCQATSRAVWIFSTKLRVVHLLHRKIWTRNLFLEKNKALIRQIALNRTLWNQESINCQREDHLINNTICSRPDRTYSEVWCKWKLRVSHLWVVMIKTTVLTSWERILKVWLIWTLNKLTISSKHSTEEILINWKAWWEKQVYRKHRLGRRITQRLISLHPIRSRVESSPRISFWGGTVVWIIKVRSNNPIAIDSIQVGLTCLLWALEVETTCLKAARIKILLVKKWTNEKTTL